MVTKPDVAFYSPYSSHLLKTVYTGILVLSCARKRLPFFFMSFILVYVFGCALHIFFAIVGCFRGITVGASSSEITCIIIKREIGCCPTMLKKKCVGGLSQWDLDIHTY